MRTPQHGEHREPSPELARISPLVTRPPKTIKPSSTSSSGGAATSSSSTPNSSKHVLNIVSHYPNDFATLTTTTTTSTFTTTQHQTHNQFNYNKGNFNNNNNNNDHFHDIYDINNSKLFAINDDNSSNSELIYSDRTNISSPFNTSSHKLNSFYDGQNSNKSNDYIPTSSLPPTPTPQTSFFQHQSTASTSGLVSGGGADDVGDVFREDVTPPPPPAPVTSIQPQGVVYAPQPHYQTANQSVTVSSNTLSNANQNYLTMAISNRASSYIVSKIIIGGKILGGMGICVWM